LQSRGGGGGVGGAGRKSGACIRKRDDGWTDGWCVPDSIISSTCFLLFASILFLKFVRYSSVSRWSSRSLAWIKVQTRSGLGPCWISDVFADVHASISSIRDDCPIGTKIFYTLTPLLSPCRTLSGLGRRGTNRNIFLRLCMYNVFSLFLNFR